MSNSKHCIYCGYVFKSNKEKTKDHVPPQCLFPKPPPPNLLTVPSCHKCNGQFGKSDGLLRDYFTSAIQTGEHPAIKEQLHDKKLRSWKYDQKSMKTFGDAIELEKIYSPEGDLLGKVPVLGLNEPFIDSFFERLIRAILHMEIKCGHINISSTWSLLRNGEEDFFNQYPKPTVTRHFESKEFEYDGWKLDDNVKWIWRLKFFDGLEFKASSKIVI